MAVTPQTNSTLQEIVGFLSGARKVCICGHVNPDGDCIGSTLGLTAMLEAMGVNVTPLVAAGSVIDPSFMFMPGASSLVDAGAFEGECDVFVTVDAPDDKRIGEAAANIKHGASTTVTIDHHAVDDRHADLSYTDPDSASTTLLIWDMFKLSGTGPSSPCARDVATCCYAGLLTDTGRFMYQNTNKECFASAAEMLEAGIDAPEVARQLFQERSAAATKIDGVAAEHMRMLADGRIAISWISRKDMERFGALDSDTENAIGVIRSVRGVEVACILKERERSIRGSLRSKGDIDVCEIAREFDGGGHKAAAGFSLECSLDEAVKVVEARLEALYC